MLEKFRQIKMEEIDRLRKLAEIGSFPEPLAIKRPSFASKIIPDEGIPAVIAEYKRASPSRGLICDSISPLEAARGYLENGAAALSVLTEKKWFKGDSAFICQIHAEKPAAAILRKDFIFHPLQVRETAALPAAAMLLIVKMLPDARKLRDLREEALKYGIESVVEIFNLSELALARDSGAELVQVNARDLNSLKVDPEACLELIKKAKPEAGERWIAASGINSPEQLRMAGEHGFSGVLVGSHLMEKGQPGAALSKLLKGARNAA